MTLIIYCWFLYLFKWWFYDWFHRYFFYKSYIINNNNINKWKHLYTIIINYEIFCLWLIQIYIFSNASLVGLFEGILFFFSIFIKCYLWNASWFSNMNIFSFKIFLYINSFKLIVDSIFFIFSTLFNILIKTNDIIQWILYDIRQ